MKKNLFKLYLLLFVPLFFLSSLTKGAEHVDLQMQAYLGSLKDLKKQAEELLHEWNNTQEKADFVKRYTFFLEHFFPKVYSLAKKVDTQLNLNQPYSEMSRNEIGKLLKRQQIKHTTKACSCIPWTTMPCLEKKIWAHEFFRHASCGEWCSDDCDCDCEETLLPTLFTLGIYPLILGILAGPLYITQGLSLFVTLPGRPRCSCPETQTKEEYNGSLPIILESTINRIDGILRLIESARKQKESLPEAQVIGLQTKEGT